MRQDPTATKEDYDRMAKAIAQALSFTHIPPAPTDDGWLSDYHYRGHRVQDTHGRVLFLSFDPWQKVGRIQISGDWPSLPNGCRVFTRNSPEPISVSHSRPAATIAADIMRRYYPAFCVEWDKRDELKMQELFKIEKTRSTCALFERYAAASMSYHGPRTVAELRESVAAMHAPGVSGIHISSADTVTIDHISAVDIETAVEILRLVAQSEANRRNGR